MSETRQRDLLAILGSLRHVADRPDRVVFVTGETGIGKTYLARVAADRLAAEGFRVAWGRADPVERAVPYAAMEQVLGSLEVERDAPLRAPGGGDDAAVLEVYRHVAALLEEASSRSPLTIVLDDLHNADGDTLLLIGFLVRVLRKAPIGWLLTARQHVAEPAPGLAHFLQGVRSDGRLMQVELAPLPDPEIAALIEKVIGRRPARAVRDTILERAAGNPFFAIQLALTIRDVDDDTKLVRMASRRVALLERLLPLGGGARTVARIAAVLGDVDLAQLEGAGLQLGLTIGAVRSGFDRLIEADLLRPGPNGRHQFVHDLVCEVLYADLGPGERRRIHEAVAAALLEARSRGVDVDLVELARHLSLSSLGPSAAAADALTEAGDALASVSPRSAALRYRDAIMHLPAGSPETSGLHLRLARTMHRSGDHQEVVKVCRDGLLTATGPERDSLIRYLALALADAGAIGDALAIVDRELVARRDSAELHTTRTSFLRFLGQFDDALESIERAATLARTGPELLAALAQRLHLVHDVGSQQSRADETIVGIERLLPSLAPESRLLGHAIIAAADIGMGRIRRGMTRLDLADSLEREGTPIIEWSWGFAPRVTGLIRTGAWDEAIQTYERGAPEFVSGLRLATRSVTALPVLEALRHRRDMDRLRGCLDDVVDIGAQGAATKDLATAYFELLAGDQPGVAARLERVIAISSTPSILRLGARYLRLEGGLVAESDRPSIVNELRADAEANGTVYARALSGIAELRFGGEVEIGAAALAEACEHGLHQYEMILRLELGVRGVDPETNLRAGYDAVSAVGAVDLRSRAETEMRRRRIRVPSKRGHDRFALTDAELRVAALVAEGMSNRAIAERLAYSVNTVETYLSRVYAKTGCANRVELARRMNLYGNPHVSGDGGVVGSEA